MFFYRENATGGALYNIGRDVQGSITHLATADGTLLKEYSYDPWGRQRDPATHAFATYGPLPDDEEERTATSNTNLIPTLHRGYCGHEHLESFGLINMNARLYDPFNGRFYSPDPYVQMPDFSQSFNRYSYCLNNPLKYKDKYGEFIFVDSFIIGLFTGGWGEAVHRTVNDAMIWIGLFTSDRNKTTGERVCEVLSRLTWQLPQTALGLFAAQSANWLGLVNYVDYEYGATLINTNVGDYWGVTLGSYIMGGSKVEADANNTTFQHEYGHYLQSQEMGWGYLSRVAVPSIMSASTDSYNHKCYSVETDANRRAFEYFSKNVDGFFEDSKNSEPNLGWNFIKHPMTGDSKFSLSSFTNMKDVWSFFEPLAIHANWYDYLSGFAFLAGGAAYGQLGLLLSLGTAVAGFFNHDYL